MRADLRRTAYQFQFPSRISLPDDATQEAFRYGHSFGRQPPFSILFLGAWESPGGRKDYAKGVTVVLPASSEFFLRWRRGCNLIAGGATQEMLSSQAGRRGSRRLPLHLFNHLHASPNQPLSHLSQLDADGSDLKALKSDQSAVTASCFRATEESTYLRSEEHTSELQSLRHLVC